MSDNIQIINGVPVITKSEGTVFGGATLNDRVRDGQGKLIHDTIPLGFGGVAVTAPDVDTLDSKQGKPVTSIVVNETDVTVVEGATTQLTATILPADAFDKTATWSTRNGAVATVDNTGLVKGVAAGRVFIDATAGSMKASVEVVVKPVTTP